VERIAVLRANRLGDLVLALPALAALRSTYPRAELTLLGAGWHPRLLDGRPGPWDRVVVVPGCPGVRDTDTDEHDPAAVQRFLAGQRERRYDLAVQLHGGGAHSNPFVRALGAAFSVGARDRGRAGPRPRRPVRRHPARGPAPARGRRPRRRPHRRPGAGPRRDRARPRGGRGRPAGRRTPLVALHLGASDPRRRWPVPRFAAVADDLTARGARVVVVGSGPDDARAVRALRAAVRTPVVDLVGRLACRRSPACSPAAASSSPTTPDPATWLRRSGHRP
jgi:ADP-heptose:LPS heptosyltransferase